ncbi:transcriptional regulator family: Fungal Specific TF [Penicillium cataractarum]|uniref:Transcriptional regulator family: Fungal Specific TF n=1 Tax=Penicillium cataractarum TaxID=2100454 RepID=A0A9W9UUY0_9EURO|nr:transcriptional regulator family: Fungal Specific TF [Penicillium cataractarum]KAJ5358448.1 transcriptional regulator family: Fungal Specific TF [Penicillium cataractarum]
MSTTEAAIVPASERIAPRIVKRRGTTRERTGCLTCRQSPSSRRHFLRYYTQTFAMILTKFYSGVTDIISTVFLPMAMHSPSLLTSLIAWSSSHLSLRDPSFEQVAIRNRCAALHDLREALDSKNTNMEITLAMSLVLCSLESIMADNGHAWYLHLVGAARIIASNFNSLEVLEESHRISQRMIQKFEDAYAGRWLLRNFAYRDIVMSVARDRAPLLSSYHFLQLDEPRLPDSHFGLASEILEILALISTLREQVKSLLFANAAGRESDVGEIDDPQPSIQLSELTDKFTSLEAGLMDWECPLSPDMSLRLLAESYRSSALIHLYRVMRQAFQNKANELSTKITTQVAVIVTSVEQMPMRCLPECTLLFPLFLAGGKLRKTHISSQFENGCLI